MCCNHLDGERWREKHRGDRKSGQRTNECLPYFSPTLTTIIRHKLCVCHWKVPTGRENLHVFSLLLPWLIHFVLSKTSAWQEKQGKKRKGWCQCCIATIQQKGCVRNHVVRKKIWKGDINKWQSLCIVLFSLSLQTIRVLCDPHTSWARLYYGNPKTDVFTSVCFF